MFFVLSKALLFLLSPLTWVAIALLIVLFSKNAKTKNIAVWITFSLFILFSNTFVFLEITRLWEVPGKKIEDLDSCYDAAIVLTGMVEYDNDLERLSIRRGADRIWQALTLYHQDKVNKILISGDNGYITDHGLHEAKQLKSLLVSWGIPKEDIITEEKSRNTYENALETKKLIDEKYPQLKNNILITSGRHMKRAKACFDQVGLECETYSTDMYTGTSRNYYWDQYIIPDFNTLLEWNYLLKEIIGYIVYDVQDYID